MREFSWLRIYGKILHDRRWEVFMELLIYVLFGFLVCMCIGSIVNILLRTIQKRDWIITFFVSLAIAIIVVPILNESTISYFG